MESKQTRPLTPLIAIAIAVMMVPAIFAAPLGDNGEPKPANKTAAGSGDAVDLQSDLSDGLTEQGVTILDAFIKSSNPSDLILSVSLECALWTEVISSTIDDHPEGYTSFSRAEARVEVWVEIDGVPVTMGDSDGRVTFCDRVQEQEITDIDEDTGNFTIRQRLETTQANAFNWAVTDVGSGLHHIVVKADIEADNTEGAYADGAVGFRTLIVEPTRFPTGTVL